MTEQVILYNEILTELEDGTLFLPTLPEVALRINDVAENPDTTIPELADVILTDAALSAQLLKVANSPLYRGRYPIDTVPMAVSRLGLKLIRNLVSSLVVAQLFQVTSPQLKDRLHKLWRYSVDVAAISHVLATKQPGIQADEAMLAGLIHNIGVLPVLFKADTKPQLLQPSATLDAVIGEASTAVGVAILQSWAFPQSLIDVIAEHTNYQRDSVNGPDLIDIVQVATLQSHLSMGPALTEDALAAVPAFKKLGLQSEMHVVEMEENTEEYAATLALFDRT